MALRILLIVLVAVAVLFAVSQVWASGQVRQTETLPYQVVKGYPDFEVRRYATANFISVTMDADSYRASSSKGFRTLAGYIFGGNATGQKIAMTTPVEMELDSTVTMKFMIPAEHDPKDLPAPNDASVQFSTERERTLAAITFSGFADDERIRTHKDQLFAALQREGIAHTGQWSFLGYDPPYRLTGRRNEVVVELLP